MTYDNKIFLISEMSMMDMEMGCSLGFDLDLCNRMNDMQLQDEYREMKTLYSFIMTSGEKI